MCGMTNRAAGLALIFKNARMRRCGERLAGGRMAFGAGLRNALSTRHRKWIVNRACIVNAVAIGALSRAFAAGREQFSMNTGLVFGELIRRLLRIELVHEIRIAVAVSAEFRHALARHPDLETTARVHRYILLTLSAIPAVAVRTTDFFCKVDVIRELQTRPLHHAMAFETTVLAHADSTGKRGE